MQQTGTQPATSAGGTFRILSLDGGGAKGFYSLGILDEIERNSRRPIHESFDLIFGTSTGAIIAALLARGDTVTGALETYRKHVPAIMSPGVLGSRTAALRKLARTVFADTTVDDFKTAIGIVATNWKDEKPLIFKTSVDQAYGSTGSFEPFFGCNVADAVIASCSAYPFFDVHTITKSNGDMLSVADGGFCANNPTLYAIADATLALQRSAADLRVVSIGVGSYPQPSFFRKVHRAVNGFGLLKHALNSDFIQRMFGTNTNSMETLRGVLFKNVQTVRIREALKNS